MALICVLKDAVFKCGRWVWGRHWLVRKRRNRDCDYGRSGSGHGTRSIQSRLQRGCERSKCCEFGSWGGGRDIGIVRETLAGSRLAGNWNELPTIQEKFTRLGNNDFFAAELMLQLHCTARGEDTQRVIEVKADRDIARAATDIDWSADNCWCENTKRSFGGQLRADPAETESQRDCVAREQNSEFRGTADFDSTAGRKSHARLPGVNGYDVSIGHVDSVAGVVRFRPNSVFDRDVAAPDMANGIALGVARADTKWASEDAGEKDSGERREHQRSGRMNPPVCE